MKNRLFSFTVLIICLLCSQISKAQAPIGYYDAADNKKGVELKTAFHNIIRKHIYLDYDTEVSARFWWENYFRKTDWHPDGYYWDMYSNEKRPYYNGSVQNREHLMPRSWWGVASNYSSYDANGDLHNLFPADQRANSEKLNYPLGEVGKTIFNNGVVKVGDNTFPQGYRGLVFEPSDEYKGDFARVYFYMVTCYEDYYTNWRSIALSSTLKKEIYPVFQDWIIRMLLEWHINDPVSFKEIERNNQIFEIQQNRNPFIDYPELAEYIWGNKVNDLFVVQNKAENPTLITPSNEIIVNFGEVEPNQITFRTIPIKGKGLTGNLAARLINNTSDYFSIEINNIPTQIINSENGYDFKIKYSPLSEGDHSAKLIFYDGGMEGSVSVELNAKSITNTTNIDNNQIKSLSIYGSNGNIYFDNIEPNTLIEIFKINGVLIKKKLVNVSYVTLNQKGVYFIKINNKTYKVVL